MMSQFTRSDTENMIMMSQDRMAYSGPQVQSDVILGGYTIYASTEQPFPIIIDNVYTEKNFLTIVPPYTKHSLGDTHNVRSILVEAESASPEILYDDRFHSGEYRAREWAEQIEGSFQRWQTGTFNHETNSFDMFFLGEKLPPRKLDKRVDLAVNRVRVSPDGLDSDISAIAEDVSLSPSRLRHLFREQIGVPIRSFRSWKRIRNAIQLALQEPNILELAMAAGYADSTHLCHSAKFHFGKQPKFMCSIWRNATFFIAQDIQQKKADSDA